MHDKILLDVRHSIRMLVRKPSFAAVIVLSLALGIGANTTMFSVLEGVLLRPLPFPDAERLVSLWTTTENGERANTAYPDYREIRDQNRSFDAVAAYTRRPVNVTGKQDPERVRALVVSPEFLSVLGVQPALGRDFIAKEGELGASPVVMISNGMWRRSFSSDSHIVGRDINLDGQPYTVIGVLPADFWFLDLTDQLLLPLRVSPGSNNRSNHFLNMIARLRPGVSHASAAADLISISNTIQEETHANAGVGFHLASLHAEVVENVRIALFVLMGAVGFVLLIACGNLASLLLAHAITREREIAIRSALGATPRFLLRQFLTESVLLSLLGGAVGLFCAYFTTKLVRLLSPGTLPRSGQIKVDLGVLLFALGAALVTAIAFGIVPVAHFLKKNVNDSLKESGHSSAGTKRQYGLRIGLVVSEVALALVLLVGSGLMIKSLHLLRTVNSGFDDTNVLIFNINLPQDKYADPDLLQDYPFPEATIKANVFLQQAVDRIREIRGVLAVGSISTLPVSGISWDKVVTLYDRPLPSSVEQLPPMEYRPVVGDYFRALGIRLISGRTFTVHDNLKSQLVAVVNQEFMRGYMKGENPIGKLLSVNPPIELLPPSIRQGNYPKQQQKFTIVGVVGDARYASLQREAGPMVYVPYAQNAEGTLSMWFAVRTAGDPSSVVSAVRREIATIDKDLPLGPMSTMEDVVTSQIGRPRIEMFVLTVFGGLALVLAGLGVYGLMSYVVARRTREIGIRMALGARLTDVMCMVMRQGFALIALGLTFGFAGAMTLTRLMKAMIYGIGATDAEVLIVTCLVLTFIALVATYFPAQRAARIDPQSALRNE